VADARTDIAPAGWQITATTIRCDMVDDLITIMVYKDWSAKCVWYARYKGAALDNHRKKFSRGVKAKIAGCQGPDCKYVLDYRDKLIAEEKAPGDNKQ
jgi:hypothetical protein